MDNVVGSSSSLINAGTYNGTVPVGWRLSSHGNGSVITPENEFLVNADSKISSASLQNFFYQCPETSQSLNNTGSFYSVDNGCTNNFQDVNNYYSRVAAGFNQTFDLMPQNQSFSRLNLDADQASYTSQHLHNPFHRNISYPNYPNACPPNVNIGNVSMMPGSGLINSASSSSFFNSNYAGMQPSMPIVSQTDIEYETRELEGFAEWFKQRRIKLGVTQADVGRALGNLKLAGVGSLSQSTICRFESLTLSHNNMIALKPILQAWLEEAENDAKERLNLSDGFSDADDRKRKRTSITDAEKRSLEAFFTIQPRPSSEKIIQIAEKLNLKKNVVRVWFCNQRQKQKRMKFSSLGFQHCSQSL